MVFSRSLWHKLDAMVHQRRQSVRTPLDQPALDALALAYVARYATTQARLIRYLQRKLIERGWDSAQAPDPVAMAAKMAERGFIDEASYAQSKAQSLTSRGYGPRRIAGALHHAGISRDLANDISVLEKDDAFAAAERLARKRRFGPFAAEPPTREIAQKQLAAMLRAGHTYDVAKAVLSESDR
jgi:regulatory protein